MTNKTKGILCRVGSGLLGAGVPLAATVSQFDFFVQRSDTTISAIGIIALIIGAVSFKGAVIKFFKTPTALKLWLVFFVLAVLVEPIIYQVKIIAIFGLAAQGVCIPIDLLGNKHYPVNPTVQDLAKQIAEANNGEKQ